MSSRNWMGTAALAIVLTCGGAAQAAEVLYPNPVDAEAEKAVGSSDFTIDGTPGTTINVARFSDGEERRALLAFGTGGIDPEFLGRIRVHAATLDLGIQQFTEAGSLNEDGEFVVTESAEIEFYGYTEEFPFTGFTASEVDILSDPLVGSTGELQELGPISVSIDPGFVESIINSGNNLGLVGYIANEGFQASFYTPNQGQLDFQRPILTLDATVIPTPLASTAGLAIMGMLGLRRPKNRRARPTT